METAGETAGEAAGAGAAPCAGLATLSRQAQAGAAGWAVRAASCRSTAARTAAWSGSEELKVETGAEVPRAAARWRTTAAATVALNLSAVFGSEVLNS